MDTFPTIVSEGVWCIDCEYVEEPDWDGDRCMACGCHRARHRQAQVVVTGEAD